MWAVTTSLANVEAARIQVSRVDETSDKQTSAGKEHLLSDGIVDSFLRVHQTRINVLFCFLSNQKKVQILDWLQADHQMRLSGKHGVRSAECGVSKTRSVENAECRKCGVWKTRSVKER